ncbi:MAG TPA: hypothetical protein VM261_16155 [Kofleriaceae bacterium]|nr:hypothetical protein [Kofleriaceae bacterium]
MITQESLDRLRGAPLTTVREHVREILEATPSFKALEAGERKSIANSMVNVMAYMVHPSGGDDALRPAAERQDRADVARAMAVTNDPKAYESKVTDPNLPQSRDQVGNEMQGGLARKAGEAMAQNVKDVDFPKFVSGLIEGVFTSIVNSSIKQMHEFGKYLQMVAMTVKDFASENVPMNEARDNLAAKYPNALQTQGQGPNKKLKAKPNASEGAMPNFKELFGLDNADPDDEDSELQIVQAHQLTMARQRQQMLATMVLMGINRIVVTDGEIKASVEFSVTSHEGASRELTGTTSDVQSHRDSASESAYEYEYDRSFWGTDGSGSGSNRNRSATNVRVASATSGLTEKSDAYMDSKAKLTGFVHVKFKSETFPLEKLASQTEFDAVQSSSKRQ